MYWIYILALQEILWKWNKAIKYEHDCPKWLIGGINVCLAGVVHGALGNSLYAFVLGTLFSFLVHMSFIDLKYLEIPDSYSVSFVVLGLLNVYALQYPKMIGTGMILLGIFLGLLVLTGAIGGGDVKMSLGLGFFFTSATLISFLKYSLLAGAVVALGLIVFKKCKGSDTIPFGPFMAIGAIVTLIQFIY